MHDTHLLSNISKAIVPLCQENKIKKLTRLVVTVANNSHVNEESLLEHLTLNNSQLLGEKAEIIVLRSSSIENRAIIESISGEAWD